MENEAYKPRANDHLVEPMYAGLGVDEEPEELRSPDARERPGVFDRLLGKLRGLTRGTASRPARDR